MAGQRVFEVVEDDEPKAPPVKEPTDHAAAFSVLMLMLTTVGKRVLIALGNSFTLVAVGTVFWLFLAHPNPNPYELVQLGMYALFVLVASYIVVRRA